MNKEQEILSEITIFGKYSKYIPKLKRRESWSEICNRYEDMLIEKYPKLTPIIVKNMQYVREKKILPSMRAMQFAGKPIEINNSRIYNCAYLPIDDYRAFSEAMFLLLGGTGVGYSVQFKHIEKLPEIILPTKTRRYLVGDNIEGWSDAIKVLFKAYLGKSNARPLFDTRDIREKGARLITSGGKAPGPEPLKRCLFEIEQIFLRHKNGEKLTSTECHDMLCHIADAVLAGGIRRAAMISLFSFDDEEMLASKSGNWWELNSQRGRANNSAVIVRNRVKKEEFNILWKKIEASNAGEPGLYFTNNADWGTNPCCEIALRPYQFCNLCEVNVSDIKDQEDLNQRVGIAAFFGTLQAGFTDFHYLRDIWKRTTEKDALIGVGMTGIASGKVLKLDLKEAAEIAKEVNESCSKEIGINLAARVTTVKPAGTTSCVLGASSGIHAWHNNYYIRRQRIGKNEALCQYFLKHHPELIEEDQMNASQCIIAIPQSAPEGSILRTESALDLLERTKKFNLEWVKNGHRSGDNTNNVSATISISSNRRYNLTDTIYQEGKLYPNEWEIVGQWMWDNKSTFNGLSVLPYDNGSYIQAPFEDITKEQYENLVKHLGDIDLTKVIEIEDETTQAAELSCAGTGCEII